MRALISLLTLVVALGSAPALAQTLSKNVAPGFTGITSNDTVVLMPVDVELFSLSAGGVAEPKADWTDAAFKHMNTAIGELKASWGVKSKLLTEQEADDFADQVALHAAVAQSIALHHSVGGVWALPTKQGQLLWSFNDAMKPIADKTGSRYALFVWMRDSYASAQRKAAMVAFALLGVGIAGGTQIGYASLVDLSDGRVVWYNRLARQSGDLREVNSARQSVKTLLADIPVR
jgi:hypothetical protein